MSLPRDVVARISRILGSARDSPAQALSGRGSEPDADDDLKGRITRSARNSFDALIAQFPRITGSARAALARALSRYHGTEFRQMTGNVKDTLARAIFRHPATEPDHRWRRAIFRHSATEPDHRWREAQEARDDVERMRPQ